MKTIGLVGGISWVSSAEYYRIINKEVNRRLGGLNFARCILYSVNYDDIKRLTDKGDWETLASLMTTAAQSLEKAGADCILLCANTMHKVAGEVVQNISVPLLHIGEITADAISRQRLKTIALLGSRYTMEMDFYKEKLSRKGIETLIPSKADRLFVNDTIYKELFNGDAY